MAVLNSAVRDKFALKFLIKYLKGNDSMEYVSLLSLVKFFSNSGSNHIYIWLWWKGYSIYVYGMMSVQREEHKA